MKTISILSLIGLGLIAALPATARISANKLAANGVAVQGYENRILSVQSVILADGTFIPLN